MPRLPPCRCLFTQEGGMRVACEAQGSPRNAVCQCQATHQRQPCLPYLAPQLCPTPGEGMTVAVTAMKGEAHGQLGAEQRRGGWTSWRSTRSTRSLHVESGGAERSRTGMSGADDQGASWRSGRGTDSRSIDTDALVRSFLRVECSEWLMGHPHRKMWTHDGPAQHCRKTVREDRSTGALLCRQGLDTAR